MKNAASNVLWLLIVFITISSCKKSIVDPDKDEIYTITGRLYQDCSLQPVAHQRMDLHQAYITTLSGLKGGFLAETSTDENGNFKFEYKDAGGMELKIRTLFGNSFNEIMLNIPKRKNISDLNLFKIAQTPIRVQLEVINSYTSSDTLFITDFNDWSQQLIKPGPFESGILYDAPNFYVGDMGYNGHSMELSYKINNSNWAHILFFLTVCDTNVVTVQIN